MDDCSDCGELKDLLKDLSIFVSDHIDNPQGILKYLDKIKEEYVVIDGKQSNRYRRLLAEGKVKELQKDLMRIKALLKLYEQFPDGQPGDRLIKAIKDGVVATIGSYGPITQANSTSAAKRIFGELRALWQTPETKENS